MNHTQDPELKIVMIGRSRVGKSATGNTILGRKAFKSFMSNSPVTQEIKIEKGELEEQNLAVIDTPGLFGNNSSDTFDEAAPQRVMEGIKQCPQLASPGPVVFLVVLQPGRFTEPEQQAVKLIQKSFGREAAHYTMALFTRGDDLKREGGSIEELIGANQVLRDFIRECRGGYHVFDNGEKDFPQVTELLRKINATVQRNGGGTVELSHEGEGDPHGGNIGRNITETEKALLLACLDGALGGATSFLILSSVFRLWPRIVLSWAIKRGMVGALGGAARFVVCRLIWRS
ncbi:GTPase IMAP family member 7-like isoform X2 [Xyrichtys novacula]|uniref:GTPase IMAP family member 8 n=1 Tax=Xyrichtys novacula TaxID=13765 RepID=A0AAV1GR10_XYRNO|nr:GTPase IMAP family member 7-like isoform X2 [Xyrichtys novacula]